MEDIFFPQWTGDSSQGSIHPEGEAQNDLAFSFSLLQILQKTQEGIGKPTFAFSLLHTSISFCISPDDPKKVDDAKRFLNLMKITKNAKEGESDI